MIESSNDGEYYYFTVRTPGFSEFSVAALPLEEAEEVVEDAGIADSGTGEAALEPEDEGPSGFMWIIPVVAVILGLLFFIIRKKRNEE